ncbi:MAG: corrinoid protein [Actinomycetota bacterium]
MRSKEEILRDLAKGVVEMDEAGVIKTAEEALAADIDAYEAIIDGLTVGMQEVNQKYEEEEYFVPEVLVCSDAMYAGLDVLRPHLKTEEMSEPVKVVIGVVQGDTHDIGKNLVKMMMETSGMEVFDLGRDVPLNNFVEKAEEIGARIICLSTLMTTTMDGMKQVIDMLKGKGIRDNYLVMIGGGPISQSFADQIGADGYAPNASAALKKAKELIAGVVAA